jgi:hypothetical protein
MHTTASAVSAGQGCQADIQVQWGTSVGHARLCDPGPDGGAQLRVGITRLPRQVRHCFSEVNDVLAGPAGDLQHQALRRQNALQHTQDRPLVPLRGRCREWDVSPGAHVFPVLPGAPAIWSSLAAMMKSFSCRPLIFLVCSDTVA